MKRQLIHEQLEQRQLLATGPELFAVRPNDGDLFLRTELNVLPVAPRELNLLFKGGADLADIDVNTTSLRITRAGGNERFDVASIRSDLGTSGQAVVDFSAVDLGTSQNGIQILLTESDHGDASGPRITVVGTQITVDLNRNAGHETTVGQLVAALNTNSASRALVQAEINTGGSTSPTPADLKVTDFMLQPAVATTDFGKGGYEVRLTARQSGNTGAGISVLFTEADLGTDGEPQITVLGSTIRVQLDTDAARIGLYATTAQQLVDAINANTAASALVIAEIVAADVTATDPMNYLPIDLAGGDDNTFGARLVSDFWTDGAVQIEFQANTATYPGAAGNGIKVLVTKDDLGQGTVPTVAVNTGVSPVEVSITLNSREGSQTTAEQLVQEVNTGAASTYVSAAVITPNYSQFTGLVTERILSGPYVTLLDLGTGSDHLDGGGHTQATARSDFGTSLDMLFTADVAKYPGTSGNAISIAVARVVAPLGDPVAVTVTGTTINVTVNTHPGKEPTPVQLRDAINAGALDGDGDRMLTAEIILPDATRVTGSTPLNLNLRLAETYDFGSDGLVALRFRAVDLAVASGLISVSITESALGTGGTPSITVTGSRIDVVLDSTTPTTAGQLLARWAAVPAASALVQPQLVLGAPVTGIVGGGARTITLDVRNRFTQRNALDQFRSLTLTDADQALVMSSFGAVNPLQIRLAAVATGAAGSGIKVQVVSKSLGAGAGPNVTVSGQNVYVELNSTAGSETTAQQLINALRANAGSLLEVTLLFGDPNEVLGGRPNTFSPLVLLGGDDAQVAPGYIGLPGDDPATPNSDPDEAARINRNEIIVRFAEVLPDDFYRIELFAQNGVVPGGTALLDRAGNPLQPANPNADREVMDFELELGAQVVSVVPQPVTRNVQRVLTPATGANITLTFIDQSLTVPDNLTAAQLQTALETGLTNLMPGDVVVTGTTPGDWTIAFHGRYNEQQIPLLVGSSGVSVQWVTRPNTVRATQQARNQVLVYFNRDPLDPASATDPKFYRLIDTAGTLTDADDRVLLPTRVSYDAASHLAILLFAGDLPDGTYRLDIGGSAEVDNVLATARRVGTLFNTNTSGAEYDQAGYTGDDVTGSSTSVNDVDLYRFELPAPSTLTATATPGAGHNTHLRLFNSAGVEIAANNSGGPGTADAITQALPAGTFYVGVSSSGNTGYDASTGAGATGGTSTGSYVLALNNTNYALAVNDLNSSFATATPIGVLGAAGETFRSRIEPQTHVLMPPNPGGIDEPSHRQIQAEAHIGAVGVTPSPGGGIGTVAYYFPDVYGQWPPGSGNLLHNLITEEEKQLTREIYEVFASKMGVVVQENGLNPTPVIKGDVRIANPTLQPGGGVSISYIIMDGGTQWNSSEWGGDFWAVLFHEIGHTLGLGHSYDTPTIMGGGAPNAVFPGDWDVVHLNRVAPRNATDIDLYQFELPADGTFSAETVAQRLPSYLNSVLTLFDADGNVLARNDDYYSKDSLIEVPLQAGTYYIGVSSVGNENYDPNIPDSGSGGRTDGDYRLQLGFAPASASALVDADGTIFDGDADGKAGGVFQFWFESSAQTIFVDKANDKTAGVVDGAGTQANPYDNIATAVKDAGLRIVVPGRGLEVVRDAQTFQVNDGIHAASVTFELDRNAVFNAANRRVDLTTATTPAQIATAIKAAVDNAVSTGVLTGVTATVSGNAVQLRGGANLNLDVRGSAGLLSGENIVRVLGNGGLDENLATLTDNRPYLIGTDNSNRPLADGNGVQVPQGTTLMIDAGALLKLRKANIDVGTSAVNANRAGGALQALGTPSDPVRFRSYRDDSLGGNVDPTDPSAVQGDWGGLVFRGDSDQEDAGIFLSWVTNSDLQHGGGGVRIGSVEKTFTPIHLETARPTIAFNTIQLSADAAMSANPNSFDDALQRIGPDIHGNTVVRNSINAMFVRIETNLGKVLDTLDVNARFDDTDIVHVITENLVITGNAGNPADPAKRLSGRLRIDPGAVVKLNDARIEAQRGSANLIAEGLPGYRVVFTSAKDDRYGMGGTFDTNNDNALGTAESTPWMGDWGGLMFNHVSSGSLDYALVTFAGGETPIEGGFAYFNALEIHEADVRIANTAFETNANGRATPAAPAPAPAPAPGFAPSSGSGAVGGVAGGSGGLLYDTVPTGSGWAARNGRGANTGTTIYAIGAQPVIVQNTFLNNAGGVLWINANSLSSASTPDDGRSTGFAEVFTEFGDNRGPLVRLNRMDDNEINGMEVGAETLTVEGVWDDTDIAHVVRGEIALPENYHTYSGLRLQSSDKENLVVKLAGPNAGFTVNGKPLDIEDRIGSSMQILGTPSHPVVLTSLYDCTVAAGYTPEGLPQSETLKGYACGTVVTTVPYADIIVVIDESSSMGDQQDFTEVMIPQLDAALLAAGVGNTGAGGNLYGLVGFGGPRSGGYPHPVGTGGSLWGTSTEYVTAAQGLVTVSGAADGYYGLDYALDNYGFRANAAKFIILVTDTTRETFGGGSLSTATYASLLAKMTAAGVTLETIVNARYWDGTGASALAVDYASTAYLADGLGGYSTATGGYITPGAGGGFGGNTASIITDYINLGFATAGISGDINQIAIGGNTTASFSAAMISSIVAQTGSLNNSAAGDWRSIKFDEYSNDRNVAVVNELEVAFSEGKDLNGDPLDAQLLGTLSPDEKSGDENRRLGFEVHGHISLDNPTDRDVYSFNATPGTEVFIDVDRTGPALDVVVELVDENGTVLAQAVRNDQLYGIAQTLNPNPLLIGDYYTHNFRDAGMRVLLPDIGFAEATYYVRVRSNGGQRIDDGAVTNLAFQDNGAAADTITDSSSGFITAGFTVGQQLIVTGTANNDGVYTIAGVTAGTITLLTTDTLSNETGPTGAKLQVNHTAGEYRLQLRLRQLDEFPGSTVRYADIRYATNGIELLGLPAHSPLVGESLEVGNTTAASAQDLGNLLVSDRAALSLAGTMGNQTQVDWYSFTVDHQFIQAIAGLNDGGKTISAVFDVDYADGAQRGDTTMAVFDAESGQLILVARDSNVEDDQPKPNHGMDLPDLGRGSVGSLDPFIGLATLPEADNKRYLLAIMSDNMLPTALQGHLLPINGDANRTYRLVRLEPVNSVQRVVEDHIGFQGYGSQGTVIAPVQTEGLFDITRGTALSTHVQPFDLGDVPLFVTSNSGDALYTVNPFQGGVLGRVTNDLAPGNTNQTIQDIVMRSDGRLYGYQRLDTTSQWTNAGARRLIDAGTGSLSDYDFDNIPDRDNLPGNTGNNRQIATTDDVDALTYERTGESGAGDPTYQLYYSVRQANPGGGATGYYSSSKLYRANAANGSAAQDTNNNWGAMGYLQPAGVTFARTSMSFADGANPPNAASIAIESKIAGAQVQDIVINISRQNNTTAVTSSSFNAATGTITINLRFRQVDPANGPWGTAQDVIDAINGHADTRRMVFAAMQSGGSGVQGRTLFQGGVVPGDDGAGYGPLHGKVTGLAFGGFSSSYGGTNAQLYGVTDAGEFLTITKIGGGGNLVTNVINVTGAPVFQGLALGPQNVAQFNAVGTATPAAYKNLLFAIATDGTLYALNTAGVLQTVFDSNNDDVADAASRATGVGGVTGLAFSPLDFNLWHPTMRRGAPDVPGHGVNVAYDNSRVPTDEGHAILIAQGGANVDERAQTELEGGASFYFGLEDYQRNPGNQYYYLRYTPPANGELAGQYGVLDPNVQEDLTSNTAIVNNYNLPGGSLGSLWTNSFSLEPYSQLDKPTLYVNYFLDTENFGGVLSDNNGGNPFRDSARIFISTDDGATWELAATNNSAFSNPDDVNGELARFVSPSANAALASENPVGQKKQQIQELFDNQEALASANWRQARVDLTAYAGEPNLRLRFDFSSAGAMNDPTLDVDGTFGEFRSDTRAIRNLNNAFEGFYIDDIIVGFAERGEMVTNSATTNPTGATSLVGNARTNNPDPDKYPRTLTGPYQVEVRRSYEYEFLVAEDEPDTVIAQTFDTNERQVMGHTIVAPAGSTVNDGTTFAIVGRWEQVFEFNSAGGVGAGNIAINYTAGTTEDQMAIVLRNAINNVTDFGVIAIVHTSTSNFVDLVGAKDLVLPEPLGLTFSATPTPIYEPGTGPAGAANAATVTVSREGDTTNPLAVTVTALANGARVTLPGVVTIPAGAASTTFTLPARTLGGTQNLQTVVLSGTVADPRYSVVSTTVDVNDNAAPPTNEIQLLIGSGLGTVTLSEATGGRVLAAVVMNLPQFIASSNVNLVVSDPSEVRLTDLAGNPITFVTIPSLLAINGGAVPAAYFYIQALNDAFSDGTRNVTITAYFTNYLTATGQVNVAEAGSTAYNRPGDSNRDRDQGQVIIDSNSIQYSAQAGILVAPGGRTVLTDAGAVTVQNLPHPGPAINFVNLNIDRLAPGAVIQNNIIANSGQQGIYFRGTPTGTNPAGNVPFGRIVNNTIYGGATASGQGIVVNDNAAPTIMNNIIANTATAIQITGATAQTGTIVGYNLFQGNNTNGTAGSSALTPAASAPLFVDSLTNNFYLAAGSLAIDSSLNRMDDRDTYFWDVKNPLGLPPSAINAPDRDVFGQQRKDDPFSDPLGGGSAVFKDRGAVDRVDFDGPYAQLIDPIDNDPAGVDRDRNATAVRLPNGLYTAFSIALADGPGDPLPPQGAGVRGSSVNAGTVILAQNGVMLAEGRDFRLGYSTTNNTLLLTPLSGVWEPDSVYLITLVNQGAYAISDLAGNRLRGNQPSGATQFTIILGDVESDYGDAPDTYGTSAANDGARHAVLAGGPRLGTVLDTEPDATPTAGADGDDNVGSDDEDGVLFEAVLPGGGIQQGVFNANIIATPMTVTLTGAGWLDGWVDFNGDGAFDPGERLFFYDSEAEAGTGGSVTGESRWLTGGEHTLWVVTPSWTTVKPAGVERYARFRVRPDVPGFDATAPFAPTGLVAGGEVEDYTVTILNAQPAVAGSDTYTMNEDEILDTFLLAPPTSVFGNDLKPGGGTADAAILVTGPVNGTLVASTAGGFATTGHFRYVPNPNFSGTDTFTYRAADAATGLVSNNIATVTVTVRTKNDAPTIDLAALQTVPAGLIVDEDAPAGLTITGILFDDPADDPFDPGHPRQVTLTVEHGVLTLATTSGLTLSADQDGNGMPDLDANGDGFTNFFDTLLVQSGTNVRAVVMRGTLAALNAAIDGLVYHSDLDFTTDLLPERLVIQINDLGYTDQDTAVHLPTDLQAMTARATVAITVQTTNDPPVIAVPANLNVTVDEDGAAGLLLVDVSGVPIVGISVSDLDDTVPPPILVQVTADVVHGGLVLGDETGLVFDVDGDGFDDRVPAGLMDGVEPLFGGTYQKLVFRGTIADVNAALETLRYYGDADFNTGTLPEVLTVEVNDLGNRDFRTPPGNIDPDVSTALTSKESITLTVRPTNDPPTITVPALLPGFIVESSATGLLLAAPFFVTPRWITVDDLDDIHDPTAIKLQVTLHVSNGGLVLGTTSGLVFDVNGDGIDDRVPALSPGDSAAPVVAGTYQTLNFQGTLAQLNAALATLRYYGDRNFTGADVLEITVDDLGNTGGGPRTDYDVHTISVGGVNDPPTIGLPASQTANEDTPLVFSALNLPPNPITVADIDVLEAPGVLLVRVSVSNGTLTLPDVTGLAFPLDIDGDGDLDDGGDGAVDAADVQGIPFRQLTMFGTPDDVNAALDGMIYQGNLDFNGTDKLVVLVNDQGNTGVGPVPSPDVTGTVTLTVAPVNDTPTVVVPGQRNGWEETNLPLTGIVVGDAKDEAYASVTLEVTLQAVHGTLHVRTDVAGGVVQASGNGTSSVVLIGTALRINRTLADPTGLVYRGDKDFNDYSLDRDPDLDEQVVITVNDRGAVGSGGAKQITGTIPISLAQVNDAPSILAPGQRTLNEDTTLPIPLIVQDIDADETPADPLRAVTVTLRLTDTTGQPLSTAGSLSVNPTVPGGIVDGVNGHITGSGTALVTISGSPVAITATLANTNGLVYLPPANYNGRLALVAVVADHGNSGGGTSLTQTVTVPIQVIAVNDPPVAVGDSYAADEDTRLTVAVPGVLGNDSDVEGSPLTPRVISSTTRGTLAFNANGSFSYVPSANFHGVDSFTYRVNDGTADSNLATVTITVNSSNDAPLAVNDSYITREDEALSVAAPGVLSNDADVDGDLLVPTVVTGPTLGVVQMFADGSFTYTPGGNALGTDQFTYTVNDGLLDSNLATVTITVTPVNDLPVAAPNTYATNEDTTLTIAAPGVLGNDVDVDGDPLTAQLVTGAANGALTLNANGSFAYTPNLNFWGTDNFTYQAHDGQGASLPVTVTITVNAVNDRPVAVGNSYTTAEDTPLNIAAPGVLGNDIDVEGDPLTAIPVASPAHGTLALTSDGSLTYTPVANYHGGDSFTYRAKDLTLTSTNVATVTITVTPVNDAPVALEDSYSTAEEQPLTVAAPGILANDKDADGDLLNVRLVDSPASGVLTLNANGSFTYTPAANFHGTDRFTYEAWDASVGSNKATVTITVTPVNDPPVATNDSYTATEDTVLTIAAPGLVANDGDVDGDALTARLIGGPAHGTATVNGDGSFTYTPAANYHGPDSFTYRVKDAVADSNLATVSLTVVAANDAPVAANDQYSTNEDTTLTVAAPGVRGNDTDIDGDSLTTSLVNGPTHGTLTLNTNGSFTYTPNADYRGQDGFTYKANDGTADSNVATVAITVVPVNDPPLAANDTYTTAEDSVLTVAAPGVKANDTDSDGDAFTVRVIGQPVHGSVALNGDGSFTYTPAADFHGTDTFTYRANDIVADSNLATVTITVTPVNDVPAAADDRYATLQGTPLVVAVPGLLFNDTDVDGNLLTVSVVAPPPGVSFSLNANGSFSYTPVAGFVGTVQFTYQAHDGTVASNVATVTITVTDSNDPPQANNDAYTTAEDSPLTVAVPGVLANDSDADGNPLTAGVVSLPASGNLALLGNGSFTYTPNANFHGSDQFTYRTFDGLAYSSVATVTITVTPVNDAPVAANDSYSTAEDTPLTVAAPGVLGNDLDVDGNSLTASVVAPAGHGTLVLNANGSLTYTPAADYHGTDTFTYQARDGVADSNVATVTITVTPVNDAPLALGDSYAASEGAPLAIAAPGVLGNDLDAEGSPLTAAVVSPPSRGTLALNGDGSFLYTPSAAFNGTDSFTYRANDGSLNSNVATVTVTVAAVNDAPILSDDQGTTNEDEPMTFLASQLLGNDRPGPAAPLGTVDNEQAQTLTVIGVSPVSAQGGTVTFDAGAGLITYTPRLDFSGTDTLTYRVADNGLPASAEAVGTLTITVVPVNDPPRAVQDAYSVFENAVLTVVAPGLLGNDYHPDGKSFVGQPQLVVTSQGVAVQVGADGSFQFDPTTKTVFRKLGNGETALDSFLYRIVDADGRQSVGTVMLTVRGISDPPYHNAANPPDVSGDDGVSPLDALLVINLVNNYGTGAIPPGTPLNMYVDVNADGLLTAGDALGVVNYLNAAAAGGEGEATSEQALAHSASTILPSADTPLMTVGDDRLSRPVDRVMAQSGGTLNVLPSTDESYRLDGTAQVSPAVVADEAKTLFDGLDADYPGVDDALMDILRDLGPAAGEAATDELLGRLFG